MLEATTQSPKADLSRDLRAQPADALLGEGGVILAKLTVFVVLVALILSAACTQTKQDDHALAQALAAQTNLSDPLDRTERFQGMLSNLAPTFQLHSSQKSELELKTKQSFSHAEADARSKLAEFYMANLTPRQLRQAAKFANSPVGQSLATKTSRLWAAQGDFNVDDVRAVEKLERKTAAASAGKRKLVPAILAVPGFSRSLARPLELLDVELVKPPGAAPSADEVAFEAQKKADSVKSAERYRRATAAQQRAFFVDEFSEADLRAVLAYLKTDGGSAMLQLNDKAQLVAENSLVKTAISGVAAWDDAICADIKCSPEDRQDLSAQMQQAAHSIITMKP